MFVAVPVAGFVDHIAAQAGTVLIPGSLAPLPAAANTVDLLFLHGRWLCPHRSPLPHCHCHFQDNYVGMTGRE